jgi:hypothetical protein
MAIRHDSPRDPRKPKPARPEPAVEPTFGDLLNGFTLDSGRGSRRRDTEQPPIPPVNDAWLGATASWTEDEGEEQDADDQEPTRVRAYTWTKGRTTSQYRLEIETLLSTTGNYQEQDESTPSEYHAIAALCHQPRSVAEVAALLGIPLGVARVLAGDMAADGLLAVHETASVDGESPDLALMERILSGLRSL